MEVLPAKKKVLCGICEAKESRYTCPKCNIPYCSVDCYKQESHADCSEDFYRNCVMTQLAVHRAESGASGAGGGDATDVMAYLKAELAKREADASLFDGDAGEGNDEVNDNDDEDDDDDGPSLEERIAGIDLDKADPEAILQCLTAGEREEFELILAHPDKQAALLKLWSPWWEEETASGSAPLCPGVVNAELFSSLPDITQLTKATPSDSLPCNLVNILFAYCCAYRLHNGDLDADCVLDICSVLADNAAFSTVEEAILSATSVCTQSPKLSLSLGFCSVVARDVLVIVSAASLPVTELDAISAPSRALLDLHNVLCVQRDAAKAEYDACAKSDASRPGLKTRYSRLKRVPEKVYFFLVWLKSSYREWNLLKAALLAQADELLGRAAEAETHKHIVQQHKDAARPNKKPSILIQETS